MRLLHLVLLIAATCLAAVLRSLDLGAFSITHWDEGLAWRGARYFLSLGAEGHYSPTHGPPLVSLSMAAWAWIFGAHPGNAVWLNVVLATGTVPLIYWVVRQIATPRAGLLAAFLLAGSGLHAMFARSLLTETSYAFFLLLSIGLSLRALRTPVAGWFLAVGLAVACTQATKYNGCLAAVPIGTILLVRFLRVPEEGGARRLALRLALIGIPVVACMAGNLAAIAWMGDLDAFFEHYAGYVGQTAELSTVGQTLAWVMPWTLLGASIVGIVHSSRKGEASALLHITSLLFVLFLFRYAFYLRLLAPVATLLIVYAGLGLDALARRAPDRIQPVVIALCLAAIGGQAWARSERYYLRSFDGYAAASAWLNGQSDRPMTLIAGQKFVWEDLDFEAPVVGLPSTTASEILETDDVVQLIVDIGAFSRLRPWNLSSQYAELRARYWTRSFEGTLNLDALQNNLTLDELRSLADDPDLRQRVLQIHVFRLPGRELLRLVAGQE